MVQRSLTVHKEIHKVPGLCPWSKLKLVAMTLLMHLGSVRPRAISNALYGFCQSLDKAVIKPRYSSSETEFFIHYAVASFKAFRWVTFSKALTCDTTRYPEQRQTRLRSRCSFNGNISESSIWPNFKFSRFRLMIQRIKIKIFASWDELPNMFCIALKN